jgi:hypothetical protein
LSQYGGVKIEKRKTPQGLVIEMLVAGVVVRRYVVTADGVFRLDEQPVNESE